MELNINDQVIYLMATSKITKSFEKIQKKKKLRGVTVEIQELIFYQVSVLFSQTFKRDISSPKLSFSRKILKIALSLTIHIRPIRLQAHRIKRVLQSVIIAFVSSLVELPCNEAYGTHSKCEDHPSNEARGRPVTRRWVWGWRRRCWGDSRVWSCCCCSTRSWSLEILCSSVINIILITHGATVDVVGFSVDVLKLRCKKLFNEITTTKITRLTHVVLGVVVVGTVVVVGLSVVLRKKK